jgi:TPR repeat protein
MLVFRCLTFGCDRGRLETLRFDSGQSLERHSIFLPMIRLASRELVLGSARNPHSDGCARKGEAEMARYDLTDVDAAALGEATQGADTFYDLGMMYSVGRGVPVDFVTAHKWFNLAAWRGNADAIRLRREVADQMSEAEIATAQRAARAWLKAH